MNQPEQDIRVTFEVKFLNPKDLKPYWRNAKIHSRRQVTDLANAIRRLGFDQPIVVDGDNVIIKGHGRQLASFELKMPLVPVVVRTDLSPEEVMAARIADNQANTLSVINEKKEREAIDKYVLEGGEYGTEFFDFMQPKAMSQAVAAVASAKTAKIVDVAGHLLTCPKCSRTFMEAKK